MRAAPAKRNKQPSIRSRGIHQPHGLRIPLCHRDDANIAKKSKHRADTVTKRSRTQNAHNHPSGVAEPSRADELLTQALKQALALVDIRTLDHFVVAGGRLTSFAERGLL